MVSATVEDLAAAYKLHHTSMVEQRARRGGPQMDHLCCTILAKVCNLTEAGLYSTLYYYNLLYPVFDVKMAFRRQGLLLRYAIEDRSYLFSVTVIGVDGEYTVRVPFPHPAAIYQPPCETVH